MYALSKSISIWKIGRTIRTLNGQKSSNCSINNFNERICPKNFELLWSLDIFFLTPGRYSEIRFANDVWISNPELLLPIDKIRQLRALKSKRPQVLKKTISLKKKRSYSLLKLLLPKKLIASYLLMSCIRPVNSKKENYWYIGTWQTKHGHVSHVTHVTQSKCLGTRK